MKTEFEFVDALRAKRPVQSPKSKVRIGIGDDCAVVRCSNKLDLVITADLLVEEIDFRLDWTTPEFIGHKALAVSLSDVSAMGAKPAWALVSLGVPEKIWRSDFVERFYDGWFRLAKKFKVELAGGDVSRTPDKLVIDSIVAGEVAKNKAVLRGGARAGDLIFVTGELGGAAAGLKLLEQGARFENSAKWKKKLLLKQLAPARDFDASFLSEKKLATAAIDLSDGLSSDLAHLCAASGTGARIYADKIPVEPAIFKSDELKPAALSLALHGGEDFELLLTANPKKKTQLLKNFKKITQIGEIVEQNQGITLVNQNEFIELKPAGFRHF